VEIVTKNRAKCQITRLVFRQAHQIGRREALKIEIGHLGRDGRNPAKENGRNWLSLGVFEAARIG
jgi:hypothetical protein